MVSDICTIMIGMMLGRMCAEQDAALAVAGQPRRLDEAGVAPHVGLGARDAGIEREVDDRGGEHDVGHRVAERGDDAHRQHEQRERHDGVGDAADDAVGPAAEEAGGRRRASAPITNDQRHRGDRDAEIEPGRDDDAAEDVAAELVGAEPVRQPTAASAPRRCRWPADRRARCTGRTAPPSRSARTAPNANSRDRVLAEHVADVAERRGEAGRGGGSTAAIVGHASSRTRGSIRP